MSDDDSRGSAGRWAGGGGSSSRGSGGRPAVEVRREAARGGGTSAADVRLRQGARAELLERVGGVGELQLMWLVQSSRVVGGYSWMSEVETSVRNRISRVR